jgi:hypothetical protein
MNLRMLLCSAGTLVVMAMSAGAKTITEERVGSLLKMANREFGELTDCEARLFRETIRGGKANCTFLDSVGSNDPALAQKWGSSRRVRSDLLVWLCTDSAAVPLVSKNGIQVQGARVDSVLDLSVSRVPFPLSFSYCAFTNTINLDQSEVFSLDLTGSYTGPIIADMIVVAKDVKFMNGFTAQGLVRLVGATVNGDLILQRDFGLSLW